MLAVNTKENLLLEIPRIWAKPTKSRSRFRARGIDMKYNKQELKWLLNLVDKAVVEASENMEKLKDNPLKMIVELNHDNMRDLGDKIRKDIEQQQRNGRMGR